MAILYVRSTDGNDTDNGSTWALAKATLAGALTAAVAGDRIYVSQNHAETQALDMTLTSPGTAASPCEIICGNDAAEPPTAVATTATVTTTGASNHLRFEAFAYVYGVKFRCANDGPSTSSGRLGFGMTSSASWGWIFDTCLLKNGSIGAAADPEIGSAYTSATTYGSFLELINTDFEFGNVGQSLYLGHVKFSWLGGKLTGAQTALFQTHSGETGARLHVEGVDLSAMNTSSTSLFGGSGIGGPTFAKFINNKLGANVVALTGTIPNAGCLELDVINSDSTDTNYRRESYRYQGSLVQETTIVRTGGASDGTTGLSWKITTLAGPEFFSPFKSPWITGWINTTGLKTWKGQIVHDSLTNLQDDEVWLEVEYLGTSGFPVSTFADDRMADILATAADQSTTGDTWTTTGLTNPNTQDLAVTATVNEIGMYRVRFCVAKPSYTVYCCPLVEIT